MSEHPIDDYTQEDGWLVLYRRVSAAELEVVSAQGFVEQPGGMGLGKHFTCSAELARAWAAKFVELGWDTEPGRVLRVRVRADRANEIHFDRRADGVGPQCFVPFDVLSNAQFEEVP
jgi:hypothetical protein